MNRRGFLRFLGLAPVGIPAGAALASTPAPDWRQAMWRREQKFYSGDRWWIVALIGETVTDGEKYGALSREILGEAL